MIAGGVPRKPLMISSRGWLAGALACGQNPAALGWIENSQQIGEGLLRQILRPRNLARGFFQDSLGAKIIFEIGNFTEQIGNAQPALDHGLVHLKMKLQTVDPIAEPKCLILALVAACQKCCAAGQRKRIAMPLEDSFRLPEMSEEHVLTSSFGQRDIRPAYFFLSSRADIGSQFCGNDLRAKADAQDGNLQLQSAAHQRLFSVDMGMGVGLADIHWPPQQDQAGVALQIRLLVRIAAEIYVANPKSLRPDHGIQRTQKFMGDVLADE